MIELTTLKSVVDMLGALYKKTASDNTKEELAKIQAELFKVQASFLELAEQNAVLRRKDEEHKQFDVKSKKYQMKEIAKEVFLYEYQGSGESDVPAHYACPQCFSNEKIAVLQNPRPCGPILHCLECQSKFMTKEPEELVYSESADHTIV